MARSRPKSGEAGTPLIFALVFFILTTIAFGVMWYLSYSDMEAKNAELKKKEDEKKPLRDAARDAELKARVYRAWLNIETDSPDDKAVLTAEAKPGDVISTELDKINAAFQKKVGSDSATFTGDNGLWATDNTKKAPAPPAEGLVDQIAKLKNRDVAYEAANKERESYANQIASMKAAIDNLKAATDTFNKQIKDLPIDFQTKLAAVTKGFDMRTGQFQQREAASDKRIAELLEEKDQLGGRLLRIQKQIELLNTENLKLQDTISTIRGKGEFAYEEPQGKILRKLPEGVVEINLGSAANVKPGLTFTVLPPDYPAKGRQSRMRQLRVPDGKGGYTSVEQFVPKGALEVYEVVGPNLSLARIQPGTELDPIRDGVSVGDLIYNSAWRKGVADHIALIGIFDVNGDGIDDIESVVRDLIKSGIPVDAYFDMKKRVWVGQISERTRYIVQGYRPIITATDANRDEKSKLLDTIEKTINDAKAKGPDTVDFRKFFSHMGYKFRLDVTEDKINQATAPYLSNVGIGMPLQP